jgi:hypothetical protein
MSTGVVVVSLEAAAGDGVVVDGAEYGVGWVPGGF